MDETKPNSSSCTYLEADSTPSSSSASYNVDQRRSRKRNLPAQFSPSAPNHKLHFSDVTVYYFERSQGFSSIPTSGGSCLGMKEQHHAKRRFSLAKYRRLSIHEQKKRAVRASNDDTGNGTMEMFDAAVETEQSNCIINSDNSSDGRNREESCESFIKPISIRLRRQMLKGAGVKVDPGDRQLCQSIRVSRLTCGCTCENGICLPETCECSQDEIKCQVDRASFPCPCEASDCQNPQGRVEFNELRVRSHFTETMMRLKAIEQQQIRLNDPTFIGSPTHIKFDDDNSTYCTPPLPLIYQSHSTSSFHPPSPRILPANDNRNFFDQFSNREEFFSQTDNHFPRAILQDDQGDDGFST